jgi:cytochrome P450
MVEVVRRQLDTWPVGHAIDVAAAVSRMSLMVSAQNLFSGEDTAEAIRLAEMAAEALRCAFAQGVWMFPVNLPGTPYRRVLKRADVLEHELLKVIARRATAARDANQLFDRLIGTHVDEPNRMTQEDLIGQMMFMFSASHETVAKAVVWSLFLLAQHPRIMAEVHRELAAACGDGPLSQDTLESLVLLDAVTKEAMRLLPPVPWIARRVRAETNLGGLTVRPKDYVVVSIYGTHRDAELFPAPLEFRPQRWLDAVPDSYGYLPFGAGPRTCIAKSLGSVTINMMVAMILKRFAVRVTPGARIDRIVNVTLGPKHGLPMVIEPRGGYWEAASVRGNIHEMVDLTRPDATTSRGTIPIRAPQSAAVPTRRAA